MTKNVISAQQAEALATVLAQACICLIDTDASPRPCPLHTTYAQRCAVWNAQYVEGDPWAMDDPAGP
jgi:hypothetical protein